MARSRNTADTQTASGGPVSPFIAGKNKIINGDFNINQRNVTSTTTNDAFIFDRWSMVGVGGTTTTTSESFTPGTAPVAGYEGNKFIKQVISGQTTQSQYSAIRQKIEDVRTFANQTVTFSFWAKADSGTPYLWVEPQQYFGTGGSPSATAVAQLGSTITISTSWTRYSVTGTIPSIAGKTIGTDANSSALQMLIWTSLGSSIRAYTNATYQNAGISVWGVQLEEGSTATPFSRAGGTIQGELAACQRYYFKTTTGRQAVGYAKTTSVAECIVFFPVEMRVAPTALEQTGTAADYLLVYQNSAAACSAVPTFENGNKNNATSRFTVAGSLTAGNGLVTGSNSGTSFLAWSAEL